MQRKLLLLLCKRYFGANLERIEKAGINVEDEDQLIEFFMPYRKKSKNKTMNTKLRVGGLFIRGFLPGVPTLLG